mgnify:CR=1 FL=1
MPTLTELIKDYNPLELLGYIDKALQILISFLRYEPEQVEAVIPVYEHICLLKEAIKNEYITNKQ